MIANASNVRVAVTAMVAFGVSLVSGFACADASQPWDLRNFYKIPIERGVMVYAEDNAEWRVLMDDGQVLADRIGFRIVLEDGTEIKGTDLEDGISDRDNFNDDFGEGTEYSVTFPARNGLRIVHSLRAFRNRPFVFIDIKVENVGTSEVQIAQIRPVVAETSVMQALSAQAGVRHRRILDTGGQPVPAPRQDATMAVIYDPAKPISFGVGLIPEGLARSVVQFKESDGNWNGDISCHYEPYKTLVPGEVLESDPLWISHGVPEPDRVDLYYSWVYSTLVSTPVRKFDTRGWFTLAGDQGLDAYVGAGARWKETGIDHVLLGRGWEGRPGSMEGAGARFPKSMKSAVSSLAQAGLQAGIAIDPLSAREGGNAWTAVSADGLAWLDPRQPEGQEALVEKMNTLKGWGANFVVVTPSLIPDEALAKLHLTRAEAQNVAYRAIRDAADPLPVFPSSISSVDDAVDDWLAAGSAVASMAVYGMTPGPLNCTLSNGANISPDLITAATFWPGPIEFSGTLNKRLQSDVVALVGEKRIAAQPVDAQNDAPHTWRIQRHDPDGNLVEDRTVTLSGAATPIPVASAATEQQANVGASGAGAGAL